MEVEGVCQVRHESLQKNLTHVFVIWKNYGENLHKRSHKQLSSVLANKLTKISA